ncbi:MAG: outer membrane beta-barrel protein [Pseudomonadota bacterium]
MNTTSKLILGLLALVALVASPSTLRAEDAGAAKSFHDGRIYCGVTPTWVHSDSLGPFSDNEWMLLSHVGFEWDVGHGLLVGIGYAGGTQEADVFDGSFDTRLDTHEIPVTLRYRYRAFEWFEPYARVAIGPSFAHASIKQVAWSGDRLRQQGYGLRGSAGIGAEFLLPRRIFRGRGADVSGGGFTLGLAVEAGYAYRLPVAFDALKQDVPKGNSDHEKQLPQGSVNLGTLDASGVYYTVDLVLHF